MPALKKRSFAIAGLSHQRGAVSRILGRFAGRQEARCTRAFVPVAFPSPVSIPRACWANLASAPCATRADSRSTAKALTTPSSLQQADDFTAALLRPDDALHHAPKSRSFRTLWLLEEIGAPYEMKTVTIRRGDGTGERDPSNPHPHGKVPAITVHATMERWCSKPRPSRFISPGSVSGQRGPRAPKSAIPNCGAVPSRWLSAMGGVFRNHPLTAKF